MLCLHGPVGIGRTAFARALPRPSAGDSSACPWPASRTRPRYTGLPGPSPTRRGNASCAPCGASAPRPTGSAKTRWSSSFGELGPARRDGGRRVRANRACAASKGSARRRRHRAAADPAGARRPAGDLRLSLRAGRDGRAGAGGGRRRLPRQAVLAGRAGGAGRVGTAAADRARTPSCSATWRSTARNAASRWRAARCGSPRPSTGCCTHSRSTAVGRRPTESLLRRVWGGRDGGTALTVRKLRSKLGAAQSTSSPSARSATGCRNRTSRDSLRPQS